MAAIAQLSGTGDPRIVIRATFRGSVRFVVHLLRAAQSWPERASVVCFVLRFGAGVVLPRLVPNDDTVIKLRGTTYYIGLLSREIYTFYELYHERLYDRLAEFVPRAGWTVV